MVGNPKYDSKSFVDKLFLGLGDRWHPAPPNQNEMFLQLTERCADLEAGLRDNAPAWLRNEFFPEAIANFWHQGTSQQTEEVRAIYFVMLAAQIMEDAWLGAQLDSYWSHPLNQGWMHYFHRWASTPSFRRWWPVIRSLYSNGFADFVKDRFEIRLRDTQSGRDPAGPGAQLKLSCFESPHHVPDGLASQNWERRSGPLLLEGRSVLVYDLELEGNSSAERPPIQVGFLVYSATQERSQFDGSMKKVARWQTPHLVVPHSLIGGGIIARFLDAVIAWFTKTLDIEEIIVRLEWPTPDRTKESGDSRFARDPASRLERVNTINFYKSRGFRYMPPGPDGELRTLGLQLEKEKKSDGDKPTNLTRGISPTKDVPFESL
jgi:hypothetical protein